MEKSSKRVTVEREWTKWIAELQAKAATDPVFAVWFKEFCKDQETLLRWDDVIGEKSQ